VKLSGITLLLCLIPGIGFGADVSGTVTDTSGKPVRGIKVIAQSATGQQVQSAVSAPKGEYAMSKLVAGNYRFTLDPGTTGFRKGPGLDAVLP
jgi:hypothetical protein